MYAVLLHISVYDFSFYDKQQKGSHFLSHITYFFVFLFFNLFKTIFIFQSYNHAITTMYAVLLYIYVYDFSFYDKQRKTSHFFFLISPILFVFYFLIYSK